MTEDSSTAGKDLTAWINSSDVEKAEWLNMIIEKLWPFIGGFVKTLLTGKVQKLVRAANPVLFDFTFTNVDLGKRPPRIGGVKVLKNDVTAKDELVVEVQVIYDGDMDVDISVIHIPAGVKDVKVEGLLRVEMKPLIESAPLIGAMTLSLLKDPVLEFNLTGLANVLDFPGISGLVRDAINDAITQIIVQPQKQIVKLSPTIDISMLRYPVPEGVARIHVIDAEKLPDEDLFLFGDDSDPYVVVKVGTKQKFKTKTIDDSNSPKWNETFEATIVDKHFGKILFEVFDSDGALMKADSLGKGHIDIQTLYKAGVIDEKISLLGVKSGKLHLRLDWFDLTKDLSDLKETKKQDSSCAVLCMYINQASDLPMKDDKPPSSKVTIVVPDLDPLSTKVVKDTNKPVWEENFEVFLSKPKETEVLFKIEDEESEKVLGELKFPVKDLLDAKDLVIDKPFSLKNSTPNATFQARLTLRVMKEKPKTASASEKTFTVVNKKPKESKDSSGTAGKDKPK